MAGLLTPELSGAAVRDTTGALIGMRRTLVRNAPGGSGTVQLFRTVGLALAVGTLLCGLIRFDDPDRWVDLLAALFLGWLIGWAVGPIAVRGAGQGLRPEWFALLPVPPRRLADHGDELMDLLRLGPQARPEPAAAGPGGEWAAPASRRRDAAGDTLWTLGILCVFPQGLVPVAFNLFGVDPQVRVWFAARYAPQDLQLAVAAGFLAVGLLAIWWAEAIRRRPTERRP